MASIRNSSEAILFGSLKLGGSRASTGLWVGIKRNSPTSVNNFYWVDGSPMTNPQQYFCAGEPQSSEFAAAYWTSTSCLEDFSTNWFALFSNLMLV